MKLLVISVCCLFAGCGVSLTTSGFKAGIIDTESLIEDGNRIYKEDIVGVSVQWLPYFSWYDVKQMFKKDTPSGTQ